MTYRIIFTEGVKRELSQTVDYIALNLNSPTAAKRLFDKVQTSANSLAESPLRYRRVTDARLARKGIRSMPVNNYRLFYAVDEKLNTVHILHLIHSRRNWTNLFKEINIEEIT